MLAAAFECDRLLREDDVRSHQPRLLARALHQNAAVDAVRKPGIVPDQRARAGLPAGDLLLEQHRVEPLGGRVDRRGETGRPGSDDRDLAGVDVVRHVDADRAGEIGQARVDDGLPVVADHHRQTARVEPGLVQQAAPGVALDRIEPERHAEPRHHVAQLQHSAVALGGNDPEQLEIRLLLPGPRKEVLAHRAVHHLVVGPRPHDVIVGAPKRDRLHGRAARRVVAIDQQDPLGPRMQLVRAREQIGVSVVDQEQRHGPSVAAISRSAASAASDEVSPRTVKPLPNRRDRSESSTSSDAAS